MDQAEERVKFPEVTRRQENERVTCTGTPNDKGLRHLVGQSGVVMKDVNPMWAFVFFDSGYRVYMEHECLTPEVVDAGS